MPHQSPPKQADPNPAARQLHFDWEEWLPYLAESDATDAEKREMIKALWSIVIAFVDLGWDVSDAHKENCGQTLDLRAALEAAVVHSESSSRSDNLGTTPSSLGKDEAAPTPDKKEPV